MFAVGFPSAPHRVNSFHVHEYLSVTFPSALYLSLSPSAQRAWFAHSQNWIHKYSTSLPLSKCLAVLNARESFNSIHSYYQMMRNVINLSIQEQNECIRYTNYKGSEVYI